MTTFDIERYKKAINKLVPADDQLLTEQKIREMAMYGLTRTFIAKMLDKGVAFFHQKEWAAKAWEDGWCVLGGQVRAMIFKIALDEDDPKHYDALRYVHERFFSRPYPGAFKNCAKPSDRFEALLREYDDGTVSSEALTAISKALQSHAAVLTTERLEELEQAVKLLAEKLEAKSKK
jgi:hypothetical protein